MGRYSKMNFQAAKLRELLEQSPDQSVSRPRRAKQSQTRLSPDRLEAFAEAYQTGTAVPDLIDEFKISRSTVFELVARLGLPRRSPRISPDDISAVSQMYQAGDSLAKVGKHFGVASRTVSLALRKAGVEIRKRNGWANH